MTMVFRSYELEMALIQQHYIQIQLSFITGKKLWQKGVFLLTPDIYTENIRWVDMPIIGFGKINAVYY